MVQDRDGTIAQLRQLATRTKDAERERTLLSLAERVEAGEDIFEESGWPLWRALESELR